MKTKRGTSDYGTLPCETMRAICKDAGLAYNGLTSVAQVVRSLLNSVAKREYLTADEKERILDKRIPSTHPGGAHSGESASWRR